MPSFSAWDRAARKKSDAGKQCQAQRDNVERQLRREQWLLPPAASSGHVDQFGGYMRIQALPLTPAPVTGG